MKNAEGEWEGITIDLWADISRALGFTYEFREADIPEMIAMLERGEADAAVAALTITPEREAKIDFTHPFYTTGLGIAVPEEGGSPWLNVFARLFSGPFLKTVGALALLLLAVGALVWIFERRRNADQFGGKVAKGLGAGFWWSAVTMTTVGYGDKAPQTAGGRLVALFWMFASIIIISSFTATIAASLTVGQLGSRIQGPADLVKVRAATVGGTTSEAYLSGRRLSYRTYDSPLEALQAVANGTVDCAVYDAPILRYLANREMNGSVHVLTGTFERQDYCIGLTQGSELREEINRELLRIVNTPAWKDLLYKYIGG